jgi:hypothetical protein
VKAKLGRRRFDASGLGAAPARDLSAIAVLLEVPKNRSYAASVSGDFQAEPRSWSRARDSRTGPPRDLQLRGDLRLSQLISPVPMICAG